MINVILFNLFFRILEAIANQIIISKFICFVIKGAKFNHAYPFELEPTMIFLICRLFFSGSAQEPVEPKLQNAWEGMAAERAAAQHRRENGLFLRGYSALNLPLSQCNKNIFPGMGIGHHI